MDTHCISRCNVLQRSKCGIVQKLRNVGVCRHCANAKATYCFLAAPVLCSVFLSDVQDFVRMMYPNATESNVRQLMSMARDQKATYKVMPLSRHHSHDTTHMTLLT